MADNRSHRSSSTLTTNSDIADSTNSGQKVESISCKFCSRTPTCKLCHRRCFPFVMDYQIFFQELVHSKYHIGPYTGFEGWEDPKLWDTLASRVGVDMCVILRVLKSIKDIYSHDNTLSALDYRLKINALIVFGSEPEFVNLAVDIMEKVLRENSALPSLPLTPHPMNELVYRGAFSRRYGEDLESLNLNGEQITNLLAYCPPDSCKYHAIADLSPHFRRETLLAMLKRTSDNISKISSSSCLTKRKRYTLR